MTFLADNPDKKLLMSKALDRIDRLLSNTLDEIEFSCCDRRAIELATIKLQEAGFFVKRAIADEMNNA